MSKIAGLHTLPTFTEWTPFTVTITGSTSNPTKGGTILIDQGWWRRNGDSVEIRYDYIHTAAGANGSGDYIFSIPAGLTIDISKMYFDGTLVNKGCIGNGNIYYSGPFEYEVSVFPYDSTHVYLTLDNGAGSMSRVGSGNLALGNANAEISYIFRAPIVGWK